MKDKTLLIMAAGMGSRFGGLKQIEPVGPNGEFIIDYSIYDAKSVGFTKVVFIIKEENYEIFKETIGKRIEKYIKTEYVFQDNSNVPEEFKKEIEQREKPLGTAHAIMCAKDLVKEPFAVINADDFYGRDAYQKASDYLENIENDHYGMVGYHIENTLSPNGSAKRGLCELKEGQLENIRESSVERINGKIMATIEATNEQIEVAENTLASMNLLLFTPDVFQVLERRFADFLETNKGRLQKAEYQIPTVLDYCIKSKEKQIDMIETNAIWYGVTYKEDKESVVDAINRLIEEGKYPNNLWKIGVLLLFVYLF